MPKNELLNALNADQLAQIAQTPLEEQQVKSFIRSRNAKRQLEAEDLYNRNIDQFDVTKRVPKFNKQQLDALKQLEGLSGYIDQGTNRNNLPGLIREGHNYQTMTPELESEIEHERRSSPLESADYNNYVNNPYFNHLIDDYKKRSLEHFKREILPSTRAYYASRGAYHSSNRAAAEQEQVRRHEERENRDIMKMIAEMQPQAAEYALQSKLAARAGTQQQMSGRQVNKSSYLNTANALQANQANDIANYVKGTQALGSAGGAREEKEAQNIAAEREAHESHVNQPYNELKRTMEIEHGLPPSAPSTTTTHIPASPHPTNPYGIASATAQLGAGFSPLAAGQNPGVPAMAEGGTVPQPQEQAPSLPTAAYTPEQSILLQMVQNFQKQHPLNRMFQTTGAHQLANLRRDPLEVFGEGILKHGEVEREHQKLNADVIHKLDDSRSKQQRLLSEMGIKTREINIDEKYKNDTMALKREEVGVDKAYKMARANSFNADADLKRRELEFGNAEKDDLPTKKMTPNRESAITKATHEAKSALSILEAVDHASKNLEGINGDSITGLLGDHPNATLGLGPFIAGAYQGVKPDKINAARGSVDEYINKLGALKETNVGRSIAHLNQTKSGKGGLGQGSEYNKDYFETARKIAIENYKLSVKDAKRSGASINEIREMEEKLHEYEQSKSPKELITSTHPNSLDSQEKTFNSDDMDPNHMSTDELKRVIRLKKDQLGIQ